MLCAELATARGSFLVDGWKVWNNATILRATRVETGMVPVRISLSPPQTLWIGTGSSVHFEDSRIFVEKGCAQLDASGVYSLVAKAKSGLLAGSDAEELSRAAKIPLLYQTLRELRPASQRP
jgi:hypothetical protein